MYRSSITSTCLALAIFICLASCQSKSPEHSTSEVNQAEKKKAEEARFKEFVENTPTLYRVNWKVCDDGNVTVFNSINKGCSESRSVATKGFLEPVFVWGPIGKVQFISKHDFTPGYQRTALFVESSGCLKSGKPKQRQQLYKVKEFWLKKGNNPQPSTNVKVEVVPNQEKEKILKQAVLDAQKENAYFSNFGTGSNGLIPTTSQLCLTVEQWRTGKVQ